jgi:hypothetical protein
MELEKIEKYLKNQMNPADQQAFEQEMAGDSTLAEEVSSFRDIQQIVNVAGDETFLATLQSIEKELAEPAKPVAPVRPLWNRRLAIGIAAAILILLAGIWVFQPKTTDSSALFADNFQAYPPPARLRGESTQNQIWDAARTAYLQENYAQAAQQFEALLAQDSLQQPLYLVHFYAGISQLAKVPPQLPAAIDHLLFVAATDSDYYQPAQWYLALAYVRNGEEHQAKALLEKMAAESSYRKDAVEALLKELAQ